MSAAEPTAVDHLYRCRALDPVRSCIVQAPAGSGKTELLVQRLLCLLARVERPGEVLAITFTRKAAEEMRSRVLGALAAASGPEPEVEHARQTWHLARAVCERDRTHGWQLRDNPGQLAILTIDGFNAALVRQLPLLSRLGGTPRIAENPVPHYRMSARRVLQHLGPGLGREVGESPPVVLLRHLDNRFDRLAGLIETMLATRDQWLPLLLRHDMAERREALESTLRRFVEEHLVRLLSSVPGCVSEFLPELAAYACAHATPPWPGLQQLASLGRLPEARVEELDAWCGVAGLLLTSSGSVRRRYDRRSGFPAGTAGAAAKERMQSIAGIVADSPVCASLLAGVRELPPVTYNDAQWEILEALVTMLPRAVAELWLLFAAAGEVDFVEVALRALEALGSGDDPSDLLLKIDSDLRHILVDEFQDTSRLQWSLLERLTAGWSPGDGRTLFLVGDPMQSIYRFREAEVGLFLRARADGLGPLRLDAIQLCSNFRSRPALVDWVNRELAGIFPKLEDAVLGAVPYAPSTPERTPHPGTAVVYHALPGRDDKREAELVAELVSSELADGKQRVAVLVRSRSHLPLILQVLRDRGIAFQGRDLDPLGARPAARDVASLTRALLHPADRLHWLAVLRAPWCGLMLRDLEVLCGGNGQKLIPDLLRDPERVAQLSVDGRRRLERVWPILERSCEARGRVGLRRLVEGCWLALGGSLCVDSGGLDDAQRVFELLETLDLGGDLASFAAFEEGLQRLFAAADPQADGRLQVMTIHKAKGLEFDAVILPALGRKPRKGEQKLLRWLDHPRHGLLLAPLPPLGRGEGAPAYAAIGVLDQHREDYESLRLLYVAVTRARERLYLIGHAQKAESSGEWRAEAGSFLHLLWSGFAVHFANGVSTPVAVDSNQPPMLCRLPAEWPQPPLRPAPLPEVQRPLRPSRGQEPQGDRLLLTEKGAEVGRMVGTEVHRWFDYLSRNASVSGSPEIPPRFEEQVRASLAGAGIPLDIIASACATVRQAVNRALESERGRWIIRTRPGAANEFPLSGLIDGQLLHAVIDRTFVEDGVRWIIDYKTGSPARQDVTRYLSAERQRYQEQLSCYATLFRQLEPQHPVRCALYFPLFDGWIECPS